MTTTTPKEPTVYQSPQGICGTCLRPATATFENEGYSSCCNDRIAYDDEAADLLREAKAENAEGEKIELLGSWGQVEGTATLVGTTTYAGRPAILFVTSNGYDGLKFADSENQHYGWRRV